MIGAVLIDLSPSYWNLMTSSNCLGAVERHICARRGGALGSFRAVCSECTRREKKAGLVFLTGLVFKYPYAYYDLLGRAKDAEIENEFDAKAWRLF